MAAYELIEPEPAVERYLFIIFSYPFDCLKEAFTSFISLYMPVIRMLISLFP
jgi:hypothetical protein